MQSIDDIRAALAALDDQDIVRLVVSLAEADHLHDNVFGLPSRHAGALLGRITGGRNLDGLDLSEIG